MLNFLNLNGNYYIHTYIGVFKAAPVNFVPTTTLNELNLPLLADSRDTVFSLVSTMYSKVLDNLRVHISIYCNFFCAETKICPWKPAK